MFARAVTEAAFAEHHGVDCFLRHIPCETAERLNVSVTCDPTLSMLDCQLHIYVNYLFVLKG